MTLEVVGGQFDGRKAIVPMNTVLHYIQGVPHTVIQFRHDGREHLVLIPSDAIPSEAIKTWLDRHA